jgi:predicted AAA+ superfamily ATPase
MVAALRIGALVNKTEWGRDAGLPPTTVDRYLDLLETSYQLVRVEAFAVNRTKRLIKSPKCYWSDTGLAMYLAGETEARGSRPGHNDSRSLSVFIEEYGHKVRGALLLHGGSETHRLGDRILATPWWRIV